MAATPNHTPENIETRQRRHILQLPRFLDFPLETDREIQWPTPTSHSSAFFSVSTQGSTLLSNTAMTTLPNSAMCVLDLTLSRHDISSKIGEYSGVETTKQTLAMIHQLDPIFVVVGFSVSDMGHGEAQPKVINSGAVQYFEKLLQAWNLSEKAGATLLGLDNSFKLHEAFEGKAGLTGRDVRDRLKSLIKIDGSLMGLFRDLAAVREWLSERQDDLNGETPLDLMLEGSMENLIRVKQYVDYLSGR